MAIQRLHWDELSPAARPGWAPAGGQCGVLWPAPVDYDQCFAAAGFTDFADTTPAWDAAFTALLTAVVSYFGRRGAGMLTTGEAPPTEYAVPSPLVAALAAAARDDQFPPCEVTFGEPAAARLRTSDGHPLLWLWADTLEWEALLGDVARPWPASRRALNWEYLR